MFCFIAVLGLFEKFYTNDIGYFDCLMSAALFLLALFCLLEYYYRRNRKYPDLQIEEDGFFVWTGYRQSRKAFYWWANMDSLAKRAFKRNVGIVYSSNVIYKHDTELDERKTRKFTFKGFENQAEIASAIVYAYNQYKKRENEDAEALHSN